MPEVIKYTKANLKFLKENAKKDGCILHLINSDKSITKISCLTSKKELKANKDWRKVVVMVLDGQYGAYCYVPRTATYKYDESI